MHRCLFPSIDCPSNSSALPTYRTLGWIRDSCLNLPAVSHIRLVNIFLIDTTGPKLGNVFTVANDTRCDPCRMRLQSFVPDKFKGTPSSSFVNHLFGPPCYAFELFYDKKEHPPTATSHVDLAFSTLSLLFLRSSISERFTLSFARFKFYIRVIAGFNVFLYYTDITG